MFPYDIAEFSCDVDGFPYTDSYLSRAGPLNYILIILSKEFMEDLFYLFPSSHFITCLSLKFTLVVIITLLLYTF